MNPKPRGRMSAYAFFIQSCREDYTEELIDFPAFSQMCSDRWNSMSVEEKQKFYDMADDGVNDCENYESPNYEGLERDKFKEKTGSNAPKMALSGFFYFCNDERRKVQDEYPDYYLGDIAKELGKRWLEADDETKAKYENIAEKDKARYEKEMTEYTRLKNAQTSTESEREVTEGDKYVSLHYRVEDSA